MRHHDADKSDSRRALWIARGLDVLVLGEAEAFHQRRRVEQAIDRGSGMPASRRILGWSELWDRAASAAAGDRPAHRLLLPASALLGAVRWSAPTRWPDHRGPCGNADRYSDRRDRRAVLSGDARVSAGWWRCDRPARAPLRVDDDRRRHAGRAIDLTVNSGETIAIVRTNGAGKSTLLRLISGDLRRWPRRDAG